MKYLWLFLLFFFSHIANGQSLVISGDLRDLDSSKPISYANIIDITDKKSGTTSRKDGTFKLTVTDDSVDHKIFISAVGYRDTILTARQVKDTETIYLKRRNYELPDVVVSGKRLEELVIGDTSSHVESKNITLTGAGGAGFSWGSYINVKRKEIGGYVNELKVYFSEKGFVGTPMALRARLFTGKFTFNYRLHFSDFRDLLPEPVIITPESSGWLTIDLSEYKIPVPKSGLYFIFTPLDQKDKYVSYNKDKKSFHANIGAYVDKKDADAKRIHRIWQDGNETYVLKRSNRPAVSVVILKEK